VTVKILTRGIPNFRYTQTQEVADVEAFIASHDIRMRGAVEVSPQYYQDLAKGTRVGLYVEGIEANLETLVRYCAQRGRTPMRSSTLKVGTDGIVTSAGTSSLIVTGCNTWYMIEPTLDPRYPDLLAEYRRRKKEAETLQMAEQDREDKLRSELDDLASALGYEEAIRRLKGL